MLSVPTTTYESAWRTCFTSGAVGPVRAGAAAKKTKVLMLEAKTALGNPDRQCQSLCPSKAWRLIIHVSQSSDVI